MININIITAIKGEIFFSQWDQQKFSPKEYNIQYNSKEDIVWDIVVIYEKVNQDIFFKCKSGRVIYVAGEPPLMRPYLTRYLKQFDIVVLPKKHVHHPHHILSHGFLNWSLGFGFKSHKNKFCFDDIKNFSNSKSKNISIVTSSKAMMPGHVKRLKIIEQLKKDFPDQIDYFGLGYNPIEYKADALLPYKFHICMENCEIPYYWTEKFADPVLANCVPIYAGCTNIDDYFSKKGYIKFSYQNYDGLKQIIVNILSDPEKEYQRYYSGVLETKKIIMEKDNLIPFIIHLQQNSSSNADVINYFIKQHESFPEYKFILLLIRFKRLALRCYFTLREVLSYKD